MPLQTPISSTAFAERLAEKLTRDMKKTFSPQEAKSIIRTFNNLLIDTVTEGNDVVLWGFGRFYLRYHGNNMAKESGNPVKYTALALRSSHKVRDYLTFMRPADEVKQQNGE